MVYSDDCEYCGMSTYLDNISLPLISLSQESTVRNFRRHATHVLGSTNPRLDPGPQTNFAGPDTHTRVVDPDQQIGATDTGLQIRDADPGQQIGATGTGLRISVGDPGLIRVADTDL